MKKRAIVRKKGKRQVWRKGKDIHVWADAYVVVVDGMEGSVKYSPREARMVADAFNQQEEL